MLTLVHCYLILTFTLYIPSLLMLPSADEDNDDVIESFWLYIFNVFPSFVYYYVIPYLEVDYRDLVIIMPKETVWLQTIQ